MGAVPRVGCPGRRDILMLRKFVLFALVFVVLVASSPTYAAEGPVSLPSLTSLWEGFWGWLGDWVKSTGENSLVPPPQEEEGGSGHDPNGLTGPSEGGGGWLDSTAIDEESDTGSLLDPDG